MAVDLEVIVEDQLNVWFKSRSFAPELLTAIHVSIFGGGKRVRPKLVLGLLIDRGLEPSPWLPLALAVELIHTSSLIHDDLPALDDDDFRRGRPTCHKVVGQGVALLAGDLLVAEAALLVGRIGDLKIIEPWFITELMSAYGDLCQGQVLDLNPRARAADIRLIHSLKTGALFRCAILFGLGAARGGYSKELYQACADCGALLGTTFQLVDDFIDHFGSAAVRGRPVSSDDKNHRRTLWSESSYRDARNELDREIGALNRGIAVLAQATKLEALPHLNALVDELMIRVNRVEPS